MEGSLKDIHLGGLLRLLSLHRFSGVLHIEGDAGGDIHIEGGGIAAVTALSGRPLIGELLVKEGSLDKAGLDKALGLQAKEKNRNPVGHYLVRELKLCSPETFQAALEKQMGGTLGWLLNSQQGRFAFEEKPVAFKDFLLKTSTENLLLSGLRSTDPKIAGESLPPASAILELAPRARHQSLDVAFESAEWNTLILFDGNRNLQEVIRVSGLDTGEAERIIYSLLSTGLLKKIRFKFPDLERIAHDALDNMGLVLVQNAYQATGVSRSRMGMRELIKILNELERSMGLIVGPTRTSEITEKMWEATKR